MTEMIARLSAALGDRYRVERELGQGGMATVYLAHDVRHDRKVAVKVLRPELAAALGSDRFLQEIRTTANLQHPHILPLFDSGEAGGFLYYVMPYVEGESLRERLAREKQLPLDVALNIAREVAAALDSAHRRGVVHRDIKPANILLAEGSAVVADFGIARAVTAAGGEKLTTTGIVVGTPEYMSPEQASGDPDVDGRSDVYALGCLLYEMLAGEPPFTGPTAQSMMAKRFADAPPSVRRLRGTTPEHVDAAIHRALAQTPADRFGTTAEFAAALARSPLLVTRTTERGVKSIVVLPFDNMSPDPSDTYLGDGLTEELTTKLSKLGSLRVISRNSAMALKGTKKDTRAITRELDVQYVLEGSVRKAGTALRITAQLIDGERDQHLWAETYSGTVEDVFGMQEQVSQAIVDALRVELSPEEAKRLEERPFQSFQAYQFYVQARADYMLASEASLDRALGTTELGLATVGENELLLVARGMTWFQLVNSMLKSPALHGGFIDEANRCADRALALNPGSATARTLKGIVLSARGDIAGSIAHFTHALALDPSNPEALLIMGYLRAAVGWDEDRATEFLSQLERLDPLTPLNAGAMGWFHWFEGDFSAALERMRPWWNAMDEGNPWLIIRAYLQAAAGDAAGAGQTVQGMRTHAPQHLLTRLGVFLVHAWRGEKAEALAALTEDIEEAFRWDDIWPLYMAAGYACLGELDRAFPWLDHAVGQGIMNVTYLKERDPFLANLRADPRFAGILEKAARSAEKVAAAALATAP